MIEIHLGSIVSRVNRISDLTFLQVVAAGWVFISELSGDARF